MRLLLGWCASRRQDWRKFITGRNIRLFGWVSIYSSGFSLYSSGFPLYSTGFSLYLQYSSRFYLGVCFRLEEEAERVDRVAAIAEEEARRFWIIHFIAPFALWINRFSSEFFSVLLWTFIVILNPATINLRLEQELVQKEAADAALRREKEV